MSADTLQRIQHIDQLVIHLTQGGVLLEGYCSVFNVLDAHKQITAPGAFHRTIHSLQDHRQKHHLDYLVPYRWNHQVDIGKVIDLAEDGYGCRYIASLDMQQPYAQHCYSLAREGVLQSSFRFSPIKTSSLAGGYTLLEMLWLVEVSGVLDPSNPAVGYVQVKKYAGAQQQRQTRSTHTALDG